MTGYLLDTMVVSETRKPKPHGALIAWLQSISIDRVYLSAVSIGELQTGVEATRQNNPAKAGEIESWIEDLALSYTVLPMDAACFREWGRLMQGRPDNVLEDMMIAATARVHGLTLATRNLRDFDNVDLELFNPFGSTK
ncbi:MAG: type II toxin-antitoxin system VapC family toxin [Terriglobales bacterium]